MGDWKESILGIVEMNRKGQILLLTVLLGFTEMSPSGFV